MLQFPSKEVAKPPPVARNGQETVKKSLSNPMGREFGLELICICQHVYVLDFLWAVSGCSIWAPANQSANLKFSGWLQRNTAGPGGGVRHPVFICPTPELLMRFGVSSSLSFPVRISDAPVQYGLVLLLKTGDQNLNRGTASDPVQMAGSGPVQWRTGSVQVY